MIRTEDGHDVMQGDRVFNYYDRKLGEIISPPDSAGWFDVRQDDGTTAYLNGERICTIEYAMRRGWI